MVMISLTFIPAFLIVMGLSTVISGLFQMKNMSSLLGKTLALKTRSGFLHMALRPFTVQ